MHKQMILDLYNLSIKFDYTRVDILILTNHKFSELLSILCVFFLKCDHKAILYIHICTCIFACFADFTELKAHYDTILRLMPYNYEVTLGKLQKHLSDEQICAILTSSDSTIVNKKILDFLIERTNCLEELLDLCDQLEKIATSNDMKIVLNKIRLG